MIINESTAQKIDLNNTQLDLYSRMQSKEKYTAMRFLRPLVLASVGSIFYKLNSDLFPNFQNGEEESMNAIDCLLRRNYDFLIRTYVNGSINIIGTVAFQNHDTDKSRHVFSIYTPDNYRNQKIAQTNCEKTIELSIQEGLNALRLGQGTENSVKRILENIRKKESEYGVKVKEDGWIELSNKKTH
jgi:hypothetical protein